MIAYRAETALVSLLRKHLATEAGARALIRELFVSSADLEPDDKAGTLTIRIHRMACPAHDRAMMVKPSGIGGGGTARGSHHIKSGTSRQPDRNGDALR